MSNNNVSEWIVEGVKKEYSDACKKHPEFASNIFEMICLIKEEAGEAVKEVNNLAKHGKGSISNIKEELMHTIVTCIRTLEKLDNAKGISSEGAVEYAPAERKPCEYLDKDTVLFCSYEDEMYMYCTKNKVVITPEWDQPLVCDYCKGNWSANQILDFIYNDEDEAEE